jgi:PhoH-like ATPase
MPKNYVLDTSALVSNSEYISTLKDANVYIPLEVIEELDGLKKKNDDVAIAARYSIRKLDEYREKGNLFKGVTVGSCTIFVVDFFGSGEVKLKKGVLDIVDNRIVAIANHLEDATVVSDDLAIRVKCDAQGISSCPSNDSGKFFTSKEFTGMQDIEVCKGEINEFYENGQIWMDGEFVPNEAVLMRADSSSAIGIADKEGLVKRLKFCTGKTAVNDISPKNKEQTFAMEFLLNPDIHMVSLTGVAGTGKTLLAATSALHQVHTGVYKKLIVTKPNVSMSEEIGFLPGDKMEKMLPWIQPFLDNFKLIFPKSGKDALEQMLRKETLEFEALAFLRGRTLSNTIFIVDEAQNITHAEAKAIITRMGVNSKLILIGDLDQIDHKKLNSRTSGLNSVIERFKDFEHSAHVTLTKGERSALATFAAKVM